MLSSKPLTYLKSLPYDICFIIWVFYNRKMWINVWSSIVAFKSHSQMAKSLEYSWLHKNTCNCNLIQLYLIYCVSFGIDVVSLNHCYHAIQNSMWPKYISQWKIILLQIADNVHFSQAHIFSSELCRSAVFYSQKWCLPCFVLLSSLVRLVSVGHITIVHPLELH